MVVLLAASALADLNRTYLQRYMSTAILLGPMGGRENWAEGYRAFLMATKHRIDSRFFPYSLYPLRPSAWRAINPKTYQEGDWTPLQENINRELHRADTILKDLDRPKGGTILITKRPSQVS